MKFGKILGFAAVLSLMAVGNAPAEQPQEWELVNPAGVIERPTVQPAPRINTLENKTIVLRWNGKHNGNNVLNRVAEHLAKRVPSAKVIKSYELNPAMNIISGTMAKSLEFADYIKGLNPDLVISSQCD